MKKGYTFDEILEAHGKDIAAVYKKIVESMVARLCQTDPLLLIKLGSVCSGVYAIDNVAYTLYQQAILHANQIIQDETSHRIATMSFSNTQLDLATTARGFGYRIVDVCIAHTIGIQTEPDGEVHQINAAPQLLRFARKFGRGKY